MSTPEHVDVERDFPELAAQLRALPAEAPERLRERVRAFGERAVGAPWRERLPTRPLRRTLLVFAPATVLCVLGVAAVLGVISGSKPERETAATTTVQAGAAASGGGSARRQAPERTHFGAVNESPFNRTLAAPAAPNLNRQTRDAGAAKSGIVPPSG